MNKLSLTIKTTYTLNRGGEMFSEYAVNTTDVGFEKVKELDSIFDIHAEKEGSRERSIIIHAKDLIADMENPVTEAIDDIKAKFKEEDEVISTNLK